MKRLKGRLIEMLYSRGYILPLTLLIVQLLLVAMLFGSAHYLAQLNFYDSLEKIYREKAEQRWIVYTEKNKSK